MGEGEAGRSEVRGCGLGAGEMWMEGVVFFLRGGSLLARMTEWEVF